jgi:hypothetical protein
VFLTFELVPLIFEKPEHYRIKALNECRYEILCDNECVWPVHSRELRCDVVTSCKTCYRIHVALYTSFAKLIEDVVWTLMPKSLSVLKEICDYQVEHAESMRNCIKSITIGLDSFIPPTHVDPTTHLGHYTNSPQYLVLWESYIKSCQRQSGFRARRHDLTRLQYILKRLHDVENIRLHLKNRYSVVGQQSGPDNKQIHDGQIERRSCG